MTGDPRRPRRVLVSGATGLVGREIVAALFAQGDEVVRLSRRRSKSGTIQWDPEERQIDAGALSGFDAVLHLAGESIDGRWTAEKKYRIRESRIAGTKFLCEVLEGVPAPPSVFLQASAIGYYGDRGDELLREDSAPGQGFLADVCREWEKAAEPLKGRATRIAALRIGMVLSLDGGGLPRMLTPIRFGLGGRLGSGCQHVSWIHIDDLVDAFLHGLDEADIAGPINCVAPETVTNMELTRKLAKILRRPAWLPLPEFAGRWILGEMADEVLFSSARVDPTRLLKSGFSFRYPNLDAALEHLFEEEFPDDSDQPRAARNSSM